MIRPVTVSLGFEKIRSVMYRVTPAGTSSSLPARSRPSRCAATELGSVGLGEGAPGLPESPGLPVGPLPGGGDGAPGGVVAPPDGGVVAPPAGGGVGPPAGGVGPDPPWRGLPGRTGWPEG